MMLNRLFLFCGYLLFSVALHAQQTDTTLVNDPTIILADSTTIDLSADSLSTKKSFIYRTFRADYPNPKKAALLAIVPGMGQVYNKKWWKVPLVYGAFTGITYAVIFNKRQYDLYQQAFINKANNLPVSDDIVDPVLRQNIENATTSTLRTLRNRYDKNLQLSYIGGVVIYLLQGVDAFVDAHLLSFDIDEDLSLQVEPTLITTPQNATVGLGFALRF